MKINDNELTGFLEQATLQCDRILQNETDAQDVGQSVVIELLLNQDKISNPKNWIISTSRNKCYDLMRKRCSHRKMLERLKLETNLHSQIDLYGEDSIDDEALKQVIVRMPNRYLPEKDKLFILDYVDNGCDANKIKKQYGLSDNAFRKKYVKIIKDISAWLNREKGMTVGLGKIIIGSRIYRNIIHFINRFHKCIPDSNWEALSRYLSDELLIPEKFSVPVYNNNSYTVVTLGENSFRIIIVSMTNDKKKISSYFFDLHVELEGNIKIIRFPETVTRALKIDKSQFTPELQKVADVQFENGRKMDSKKLVELLESQKIKIKVCYCPHIDNKNNQNSKTDETR